MKWFVQMTLESIVNKYLFYIGTSMKVLGCMYIYVRNSILVEVLPCKKMKENKLLSHFSSVCATSSPSTAKDQAARHSFITDLIFY